MLWHPYFTFTNNPVAPPPSETKTGAGGIDPHKRASNIVKPTGLSVRPQRKKPTNAVEARIEQRIDDAIADVAPIVSDDEIRPLAPLQFRPITEMSLRDIDAEIRELLHKKLRTDDEDRMLIILLASCL